MITAKEVKSILLLANFNPKTDVTSNILAQQQSCSYYEHDIKIRISQLISAADTGHVDTASSYENELVSIMKDAVLAIHTMRTLNGTNDTKTKWQSRTGTQDPGGLDCVSPCEGVVR